MRGDYTLEHLDDKFHQIGVQRFELIEYPSDKHVGKDRSHGTFLIKLYTGSCGNLMEPWEVQKYSHTPGT